MEVAEIELFVGSVFLEDARILAVEAHPGHQFIMRVHAPRAARKAAPGTFAHIACDPSVSLRRPLSIMRVDADAGWLEFLYKPKSIHRRTDEDHCPL